MYCLLGEPPSAQATLFPIVRDPAYLCHTCKCRMRNVACCRDTRTYTIFCGHAAVLSMLSVMWCPLQKAKCTNKPGSYLVQHTYRKAGKLVRAGTCQARGHAMRCIAQGHASLTTAYACALFAIVRQRLDLLSEHGGSISRSLIPRRASNLMCLFPRQRLCVSLCCFCRWLPCVTGVRQPLLCLQQHGRPRQHRVLQVGGQQRRTGCGA